MRPASGRERTYRHSLRELQGGMEMSTTVNGVGSANSRTAMMGTLTIQKKDNPYARMANFGKPQKKAAKQLNYNHREISGQIMRAKKAQSAATVLTRAKSKLAVLQRQAGTGQYNQKEVASAIAHAKRMVRCAQLKVRNLREEEREQKAHQKENGAKTQQKQGEVRRRVAAKERELKQKVAIEETQAVIKEKQKRSEMAQKRRMHRNEEHGKIAEADMKYIKEMSGNNSGYTGSSYDEASGIAFDISSAAIALAELALMEQARNEIEMEIEAEVEAEMALESGQTSDVSGSMGGGTPVTDSSAAAGGEAVAPVDVSV